MSLSDELALVGWMKKLLNLIEYPENVPLKMHSFLFWAFIQTPDISFTTELLLLFHGVWYDVCGVCMGLCVWCGVVWGGVCVWLCVCVCF